MDKEDHLLKGHSKPGKDETWNPKGKLVKGENPNRNFVILLVKNPCVVLSVAMGSLQSIFVMPASFGIEWGSARATFSCCKREVYVYISMSTVHIQTVYLI